MNSEETENAALRGRIADLEQQLKLSDEGNSRLAQRCLELEQQALAIETRQELHTGSPLLLPQLFYDTGAGFSAQDSLTAPPNCCNELTHEVTAAFELPTDAVMLRFDPGELPCCVMCLNLSDERLSCRPVNGISTAPDRALFVHNDPNFYLDGLTHYPAGLKLVISYLYYPLEQLTHEPLFNAVLSYVTQAQRLSNEQAQQMDQCRLQLAGLQQELAALQLHSAELQQQLIAMELDRREYAASLESMQRSTSWRLTAPLRSVSRLFRRG